MIDISSEYIHGDKFYDVSDFIFSDSLKQPYNILNNHSGVIFCKAEYLKELFSHIEHSKNKYILITHNSDINIDRNIFNSKPSCIKKWFAQNVAYKNSDLIPIPIGMERPKICTSRGMVEGENSDINILKEIMCCTSQKNNVLMAFNVNTNIKERKPVLDFFINVSWVTCVRDRITFKDYINTLRYFKFVISPEGNGIDCHRTWEAIYIGVIPIVKRSAATESFRELPILIVEDFFSLTEDFLMNSYEGTIKKNLEKATMSFWSKQILDATKYL